MWLPFSFLCFRCTYCLVASCSIRVLANICLTVEFILFSWVFYPRCVFNLVQNGVQAVTLFSWSIFTFEISWMFKNEDWAGCCSLSSRAMAWPFFMFIRRNVVSAAGQKERRCRLPFILCEGTKCFRLAFDYLEGNGSELVERKGNVFRNLETKLLKASCFPCVKSDLFVRLRGERHNRVVSVRSSYRKRIWVVQQ